MLAVTTTGGTTTLLDVAGLTDPTSLTAAGTNVDVLVKGGNGDNLWSSDGTLEGTQQISFSDSNDVNSTNVSDLTAVGSTLFFLSNDPGSQDYGDDLWTLAPDRLRPRWSLPTSRRAWATRKPSPA